MFFSSEAALWLVAKLLYNSVILFMLNYCFSTCLGELSLFIDKKHLNCLQKQKFLQWHSLFIRNFSVVGRSKNDNKQKLESTKSKNKQRWICWIIIIKKQPNWLSETSGKFLICWKGRALFSPSLNLPDL